MTDHDNDAPAIDTNLVDDPIVPDEPTLTAEGGWCSPSDAIFPLLIPEVTVRRGGISFTAPPAPLQAWKKKTLIHEVEQLREDLARARGRERELERKNRRLRRAIKRLIG